MSQEDPIIQFVIDNNVDKVAELLDKGANPNAVSNNGRGYSCLHFASQNNSEAMVQLLLENDVDVTLVDNYGNTPLWTAVFNYKNKGDEVIKSLLDYGSDPDHKNKDGKSPRELANLIANYDVKKFFAEV